MKIKMTKSTMGAHDGKTVREYKEGQVYDLADDASTGGRAEDLARSLVKAGVAVEMTDAQAEADAKAKAEAEAKARAEAEAKAKAKAEEAEAKRLAAAQKAVDDAKAKAAKGDEKKGDEKKGDEKKDAKKDK